MSAKDKKTNGQPQEVEKMLDRMYQAVQPELRSSRI